jgi:SAM-dependent methyltransferase
MKLADAVSLINDVSINLVPKAVWADLGCGSGLFTRALAQLLSPGSTIYAIDKDAGVEKLSTAGDVTIFGQQLDFVNDLQHLPLLDGIVMANSLHYVEDQQRFVTAMSAKLNAAGKVIIVEYDTDRGNRWVPFPLKYSKLTGLFHQAGYVNHRLLARVPSVYRDADIYGCLFTRA